MATLVVVMPAMPNLKTAIRLGVTAHIMKDYLKIIGGMIYVVMILFLLRRLYNNHQIRKDKKA